MLKTNKEIHELEATYQKESAIILSKARALCAIGLVDLALTLEDALFTIGEHIQSVERTMNQELQERFEADQAAFGKTVTALLNLSEKE